MRDPAATDARDASRATAVTSGAQAYWDRVYSKRGIEGVSWFQESPEPSLRILADLDVPTGTAFVDVGGGASRLADSLLERGWADVTVLDASSVAVMAAEQRVGESPVSWLVENVLRWSPARSYEVWHDRALFHFLTGEAEREQYRACLHQAVRPGGWVVIGAFAPDGPEQCSGLPVVRYDEESLQAALGPDLDLVSSRREQHVTPAGVVQRFLWAGFRVRPGEEALDEYLASERGEVDRVPPAALEDEVADGALVVDLRPLEQRVRDGVMPWAVVVDRNVMEWRLVTTSRHRLPVIDSPDKRIVLVCNQGYASSLAAANLRRLGMVRATDLEGGFEAWAAYRAAEGKQ